jgi:hypothetical protein
MRLLIACFAATLIGSFAFAADVEEGFTRLFDGKTLDGWEGDKKGYTVEEGVIKVKKQGSGNLYTAKEYGDFEIRFEFKLTPGANNGLGIRTPRNVDAAYEGMEIQILDDSADVYKNLAPYQYHGSIYDVVACKKGHQKPVGEWNSQTVIAKGKQVKVILNGETIVDADIEKASTPEIAKRHPGLKREKGYIGFCGHGSELEFRNIRIKELK